MSYLFVTRFLALSCSRVMAIIFTLLTLSPSSVFAATATADSVFDAVRKSVYQVKIIEEKSGSQSALGTGFVVSHPEHGKLIATNYHVVSGKVLESQKYRVEVEVGDALIVSSVVAVDVVNDLALLQAKDHNFDAAPFVLAETQPKKGTVVYSLGNPHDLGLTVVQGNYNGFVEDKFLQRIHFSGAVNSGMSGGPSVDASNEVIGINVASSGNQIGFLVPVTYLRNLISELPSILSVPTLFDDMSKQISATTDAMVTDMLSKEWQVEKMQDALVLSKTADWMECWGDSDDDKKMRSLEVSRGCNNADRIFLGARFFTGFFEYEFYYVEADTWPTSAFYRILARNTGNAVPGNSAGKKSVGNYSCSGDVVIGGEHILPAKQVPLKKGKIKPAPMQRKVSYCVRAYQHLPNLFDIFYVGVSVDKKNQALMEHFTLSGVTQKTAHTFLEKFMEVAAWQSL